MNQIQGAYLGPMSGGTPAPTPAGSADSMTNIVQRSRPMLAEIAKMRGSVDARLDAAFGFNTISGNGAKDAEPPEPAHVLFQARRVENEIQDIMAWLNRVSDRLATNL